MKLVIVTCVAAALAVPGDVVTQYCRHQSGNLHVFAEVYCDGNLAHVYQDQISHHDHGHEHPEDHSGHSPEGEHHEPCTHESISTQVELASANVVSAFIPDLATTLLAIDLWWSSHGLPPLIYLKSEPRVRGPPGLDDPLRQFTSCIRLTA
jgi:hypothetical protein